MARNETVRKNQAEVQFLSIFRGPFLKSEAANVGAIDTEIIFIILNGVHKML